MRVIKNFFHNINDILLAIIIVALAAGIIYWRMGIILDYPRQFAAEQAAYEQELDDAEDADDEEDAEEAEDAEDAEEGDASGDQEEAAQPQG